MGTNGYETHTVTLIEGGLICSIPSPPWCPFPTKRCEATYWGERSLGWIQLGAPPAQVLPPHLTWSVSWLRARWHGDQRSVESSWRALERRYATRAPEYKSLMTWWVLTPPRPVPWNSAPFARITSSVANCSKGSFGGSNMSSDFPSGFRDTLIEVSFAILQILQNGFLGKWDRKCSGAVAARLNSLSLVGSPSARSFSNLSSRGCLSELWLRSGALEAAPSGVLSQRHLPAGQHP